MTFEAVDQLQSSREGVPPPNKQTEKLFLRFAFCVYAKMRLVILSDSHADSIDGLPKRVIDELSGADLVVHAGDYTGMELLEWLRRSGNFKGVYGNMDPPEIKKELPAVEAIVVGGYRVGVSHPPEGGSSFGIEGRIRAKFKDVDVIIFGHTHRTRNERKDGVLYFNPGSVTGTFPATARTFGIITVEQEVRGEIIRI